jgi:bifunctional UDP-N-acetylglucosamine pyrophosphorylase/glucosamine-1-phosphate N-acetyltransferase
LVDLAEKGADLALLMDKISKVRASDWICGNTHGNKVVDIVFHPRRKVTHRIGGAFIVNEKVFKYLEYTSKGTKHAPTGVAPSDEFFLEETIALMLDDGEEIHFVEPYQFLVDVDKPWHVLEANEKFLDYLSQKYVKNEISSSAQISERAEINGVLIAGNGAVIGSNAFIEDFLIVDSKAIIQRCVIKGKTSIGGNSVITDFCKIWSHTSIGSNVRIMHAAEVKGVIMNKVSIMHNSYVNGVIGESVDIGAGTVIGDLRFNDLPPRVYTKGRREEENIYMNAAFIGDYSRTGINVSINPGVRIGAKSIIGPGVTVYKDVPSRKILIVKQDIIEESWDSSKYGF